MGSRRRRRAREAPTHSVAPLPQRSLRARGAEALEAAVTANRTSACRTITVACCAERTAVLEAAVIVVDRTPDATAVVACEALRVQVQVHVPS